MIAVCVGVLVLSVALALAPPAPATERAGWWRRARDRRAVERALPELLEALARSLRAGTSTPVALRSAAAGLASPLVRDVERIGADLDRGRPFEATLESWATARASVPGVRLAAVAITMAAEAGGSVARAVDGVADTLREDLELQAEVQAMGAQAKASAVVVAALPVLFLAMLAATDADALAFLVDAPLGRICLVTGAVLQAVGFWWMHRIVRAIA